jgi:hypothetical protein
MSSPDYRLPVPGWEGFYEATRDGHVYSVERVVWGGSRAGFRRVMAKEIASYNVANNRYYIRFQNAAAEHAETMSRARAVLTTFGDNADEVNMQALHWDGNSLNDHIDNLYWGTHSDNMQDAVKHGTAVGLRVGNNHPATIHSDELCVTLYHLYIGGRRRCTYQCLAKEFGVIVGSVPGLVERGRKLIATVSRE